MLTLPLQSMTHHFGPAPVISVRPVQQLQDTRVHICAHLLQFKAANIIDMKVLGGLYLKASHALISMHKPIVT